MDIQQLEWWLRQHGWQQDKAGHYKRIVEHDGETNLTGSNSKLYLAGMKNKYIYLVRSIPSQLMNGLGYAQGIIRRWTLHLKVS